MNMNERKKKLTGLLTMAFVIFMTAISAIQVKAENGVNSTGNIIFDNGDMALHASDIDYLETEKNELLSEMPVLPDGLNPDGMRHENIKSKGIIDYAGGKVVIDASDLMYLANEIDVLEAAYKMNTVAALNYMGTYYMEDGSVTHNKSEESLPAEYAVNLSFEEIYDGVLQSQSVENLAITEEVTGASADNLSTGTAAWLDGELVVGNGADNDASYQKGYTDGIAAADARVNTSSASYQAGYNAGYNAGRAQGQNEAAPKAFGLVSGSTQSYTCPRAGTYQVQVYYAWFNNRSHNNIVNKLTVNVPGAEYKYLDFHPDSAGVNWIDDSVYQSGSVLTLNLNAGDVISITASSGADDCAGTYGAWLVR